MTSRRILVCSEDISEPLDEGIKKAAVCVIESLSGQADVLVVYKDGKAAQRNFQQIRLNRLFLRFELKTIIKTFRPDVVLYIPRWCGTFASFIRMKILSSYDRSSRSAMIILQPKKLNALQRKIIEVIKPDIVLTPSPRVMDVMARCGIRVEFLPIPVDEKRFRPLPDAKRKKELRMKYGLPTDKCIILHVGHINAERNLEALVQLQKDDNQVVIIGSSSTQDVSYKDERLKKSLIEQGLQIIDGYIKNIEELYQLSDVYVFPVVSEKGCIGVPLSILEARACGLPVVSTAFGGLKRIYNGTTNEITYARPSHFGDKIAKLKLQPRPEMAASDARRIDLIFRSSLDKIFQG